MTFIASVRAKNGAVIISDSLVTTTRPILEYRKFINYVKDKSSDNTDEDLNISLKELSTLFDRKPVFTQDYREKIIILDDTTVITTAGSANIMNTSVMTFIESLKKKITEEEITTFDNKMKFIIRNFSKGIREEFKTNHAFGTLVLVFTHFDQNSNQTRIVEYRSITNPTPRKINMFNKIERPGNYPVICDGQTGVVERILYGDFFKSTQRLNRIIEFLKIKKYLKKKIPIKIIEEVQKYCIKEVYEDINLINLKELSLQQAINLACLLLQLERDFQEYTKDIPTIGGIIKIVVIDKNGAKFIHGDVLEIPDL